MAVSCVHSSIRARLLEESFVRARRMSEGRYGQGKRNSGHFPKWDKIVLTIYEKWKPMRNSTQRLVICR